MLTFADNAAVHVERMEIDRTIKRENYTCIVIHVRSLIMAMYL